MQRGKRSRSGVLNVQWTFVQHRPKRSVDTAGLSDEADEYPDKSKVKINL